MATIFDVARFGQFVTIAASGWVVEQVTANAEPDDKLLIQGITRGATLGAGIGSFLPIVGTSAGALLGAFYGLITNTNTAPTATPDAGETAKVEVHDA